MAADGVGRAALEDFIIHEARLLDARRFRDWMELFAEDGTYWVPAVPDQKSPFDQASLFYDDRELMKTRVERLEHPRIHVQTPPSRTAHLVGNIVVEEADETVFWLELLGDTAVVPPEKLSLLLKEANELLAICAASLRTAKQNKGA